MRRTANSVISVFGLEPIEDAPVRATLAAIATETWTRSLQDADGLPVIATLHAGRARVQNDGSGVRISAGDLSALEAVLEGLSAQIGPNAIVASEPVARLLTRRFVLEPCRLDSSAPALRGAASPGAPSAFRVARARRSFAAQFRASPSAFVGREGELAFLMRALAEAKEGRGRVIGILGEPGVGKSRLVYELCRRVGGDQFTYLESRCLSYGASIPYGPVLDLVRTICEITHADDERQVVEKVRVALHNGGIAPDQGLPYLLRLLGVRAGTESIAAISAETIKARTFELLRRLALVISRRRPVVLVVEDVHWIDPTSEEFLLSLVERLPGAPVMLLVTYRPAYRPTWIEHTCATQLALGPLSSPESLTILRSVLQADGIDDTLADTIVRRAEGNPFVLEELALSLNQRDQIGPITIDLPDSIRGMVASRINRLPAACQQLLETAAVLGREVSPRLLREVWREAGELDERLRELIRPAPGRSARSQRTLALARRARPLAPTWLLPGSTFGGRDGAGCRTIPGTGRFPARRLP